PVHGGEATHGMSAAHGEAVTATHPAQEALAHAVHASHTPAMITSLILAGLGILVAWGVYRRKVVDPDAVAARLRPLHTFLTRKWYFDEIYEQWVVVPFVLLTTRVVRWFDETIIDGAVNGAAAVTRFQSWLSGVFDKYVVDGLVNLAGYTVGFFGIVFRKTQTGRIQTYIALAVFGALVLFYVFY
ncbi:MAG: NADH-quinone oxidoreductase subunit L, partial [Bacteroidota bacterium]|nr:NADH-quinone oxidoreductase subunit L [Bacteroidota bacterium]